MNFFLSPQVSRKTNAALAKFPVDAGGLGLLGASIGGRKVTGKALETRPALIGGRSDNGGEFESGVPRRLYSSQAMVPT